MKHTIYNICAATFVALFLSPAMAMPQDENKNYLFTVSYAEAEEAVAHALADAGAADKVAARINNRKYDTPLFSYSKPMTVELRGLKFDKASLHWSGNLLAISDKEVITAIPAAGRFDELTEVPVLRKQVQNGQVITAENIEIRDIPAGQVRVDTITDMGSLVGKSPTRQISASRPIRDHEIGQPPLVKKNSIVQMRFISPGMEITTSGQALSDGAKGASIEVRNMSSKRIVQAIVEDVATVSVSPPDTTKRAETPGGSYATN